MNSHDEHSLEKAIHAALRSAPERRAPQSLEARVMAAIAARQSLPWYRRPLSRWPVQARMLGLASATLLIALVFRTASQVETAAPESVSWLGSLLSALLKTASGALALVPSPWLYAALALFGTLYIAFLGIGATACRALLNRH